MTAGILVSIVLAAAAIAFVAAPLFRANAAEAERVARHASEEVDLQQRREMVMAALRDLEEDRATDKISAEDYEQMHARLSAQAIGIMNRRDELEDADRAKQRAKTVRHPSARSDTDGSPAA